MTAAEQNFPGKEQAPKTIYLKDYRVPEYLIKTTDLRFEIYDGETLVSAMLHFYRNPAADVEKNELTLNGADLELVSIALDGDLLDESAYEFGEESLTIFNTPDEFYAKHQQKLNSLNQWIYSNIVRHQMNKNVRKIRAELLLKEDKQ